MKSSKFTLPQKTLAKIFDILKYDYDFSSKEYNGCKSCPLDEYSARQYLREELWSDTSRNPEQIIKLVRFLDRQNIPIEKLKLLKN